MSHISLPARGYVPPAPVDNVALDLASATLSAHEISNPLLDPDVTIADMAADITVQTIVLSTRIMLAGRDMALNVLNAAADDDRGCSDETRDAARRVVTLIEHYSARGADGIADTPSPAFATEADPGLEFEDIVAGMDAEEVDEVWRAVIEMEQQVMEGDFELSAENEHFIDDIRFGQRGLGDLDYAAETIEAALRRSPVRSPSPAFDESDPDQ